MCRAMGRAEGTLAGSALREGDLALLGIVSPVCESREGQQVLRTGWSILGTVAFYLLTRKGNAAIGQSTVSRAAVSWDRLVPVLDSCMLPVQEFYE